MSRTRFLLLDQLSVGSQRLLRLDKEPLAILGQLSGFGHDVDVREIDRAKRRAAMMADPEWQVYLKKLAESELLVDQRTSLMVPTKFAPMK